MSLTDSPSATPQAHSVLLEGDAPSYVHLLPAGVFSGQDGRGPYHVNNIDDVIRASRSDTGLVIDYDHQTDYAARPGVGMAAPAAGWIRDIEKRADGIWGHVEWTPKASDAIKQGEYRYLSPVFLHDDDGVILRILRAGLTNNPNLALKALNVEEGTAAKEDSDITSAIAKSLNIQSGDEESSLQDILAAIDYLKEQTSKAREAYHQLLALSGLQETEAGDVDWSLLQDSLNKLLAEQAAHASSLCERMADIEQQAAEATREQLVGDAIKAGKLPPALRAWAISYHSQDAQGFAQFLQGQPSLMIAHGVPSDTSANTSSQKSALSDADISICKQLNLSPERFALARARFKDSFPADSSTF